MKNIQQVEQHLKEIYPYQKEDFSRLGPAHKSPHYDDIVFRSTDEHGSGVFIKGFSSPGYQDGTAELEMINLFNSFSTQTNGLFRGPELIAVLDQPLHFVMKEFNDVVDFGAISQEKLMSLYESYRSEFDEFEIFSGGKTTTFSKDCNIQDSTRSIDSITSKQLTAFTNRVTKSKTLGIVEGLIPGFSQKAEQIFQISLSQLRHITFEYTFGRLWTGHVFGNQEKGYGLVDFDNVGYQIKGTELLGLIWSNILCNCHNFSSYQIFKNSFDYWYQKLHHNVGDEHLANHLTIMKLLGTIYADYGYLMNTESQNRAHIKKLGYDIEQYNTQGIKWNYQLLCDYFPEFTI